MYYFVREVQSKDYLYYSMHSEGFCKDLELQSEFLDGRVYIDGYFTHDIGVGDVFHVDSKPEYRLKCIKFLL